MDLEQDAMLTAIGQMSMEQAREKWADRWGEFVQSMSRWRSIYVLLRMARLNAQQQKLAQYIPEQRKRLSALVDLRRSQLAITESIEREAWTIESLTRLKADAEEESKGPRMTEYFDGRIEFDNPWFEAPRTHRGKKIYADRIAAAIQAAFLTKEYEAAGGDKYLDELSADYRRKLAESAKTEASIKTAERNIQAAKIKQMELQDEYDITKPYAMGLLVADIFKSLAMAIQGEIY